MYGPFGSVVFQCFAVYGFLCDRLTSPFCLTSYLRMEIWSIHSWKLNAAVSEFVISPPLLHSQLRAINEFHDRDFISFSIVNCNCLFDCFIPNYTYLFTIVTGNATPKLFFPAFVGMIWTRNVAIISIIITIIADLYITELSGSSMSHTINMRLFSGLTRPLDINSANSLISWKYCDRIYSKSTTRMYSHPASGHIPLAQSMWSQSIQFGDTVIDATCGNGHDSLTLGRLCMSPLKIGKLVCIDIQQLAIDATKERLQKDLQDYRLYQDRISYHCQSHETFPSNIVNETVSAITYNLGYLPRAGRVDFVVGQGPITTASTSIQSISNAMMLVKVGGLMTITCYRGHDGGKEEYEAVNDLCMALDPERWRVYSHVPANRPIAPVLITLFKTKSLYT